MKADEVARYLHHHPKFFDEYAELLAQLYLPHPHGGRAISITERQILTLREKARQVEAKLAELIGFGEENDAIGEKVQRLAVALIAAPGGTEALRILYAHLAEDFAVPHVAIRVWGGTGGERMEFSPVAEAIKEFAANLSHPYCGKPLEPAVMQWLGEPGGLVRSIALTPLRRGQQTIGLLLFGSEDIERFFPEMGTLYLQRIGELSSAALCRGFGFK